MAQAQPHDAGAFTLTLAGATMNQAEPKGLLSLVVEDHLDMIGMAEATFLPESEVKWDSVKFGSDVEVVIDEAGENAAGVKIFVGIVTEIRYSVSAGRRVMVVSAMDPLCKLAASRHTRVFEDKTDSDIVSSVLGSAGVQKGAVDSTSGANKYTFQRNEPDLYFLKRLAARNGYLLTAKEGKIDFKKTQFSGSPVEIAQDEVESFEVSLTNAHLAPKVTVVGWDYIKKEVVTSTADKGKADAIGSGTNAVGASDGLWSDPAFVADLLVATQSGADAMAASELNRLGRTFLRGRAVVHGNAKLHAGVKVKFTNFGDKLNAEGIVISSRHSVGDGGFRTEIHFCGNTALV
jgi:phage protein D